MNAYTYEQHLFTLVYDSTNCMRRRQIIKSGAALSTLGITGLAGCTGGGDEASGISLSDIDTWPPEEHGDQINVWSWKTEYRDASVPMFTEEYGIDDYSLDSYNSPGQWYSQIQGSHSIDYIDSTNEFTGRAMEDGLAQPMPVEHMPNWDRVQDHIQEEMMENYAIDGEIYGFPTVYYLLPVIIYNEDYFDSPPTSWDFLWDESLEGQIANYDRDYMMMQIAAQYTGQDPLNPSDYEELEEVLIEQRPLNRTIWSNADTFLNQLGNEEIIAAAAGVPQAAEARAEYDVPINYALPEEGAYFELDNGIIPEGAPNPVAGAMYANWGLSDHGIRNFWEYDYAPTFAEDQDEVVADMIDDPELAEMASFSDEEIEQMQLRTPLSEEDRERTAELYSTVMGA